MDAPVLKKMKCTVELNQPMRSHLLELGSDNKQRKLMRKKLEELIAKVLQHPHIRVHYCLRSGQAIFMLLENQTELDVDGSKIMMEINKNLCGVGPLDYAVVDFGGTKAHALSSALFCYAIKSNFMEKILEVPEGWKVLAVAAVLEQPPDYISKALDLLQSNLSLCQSTHSAPLNITPEEKGATINEADDLFSELRVEGASEAITSNQHQEPDNVAQEKFGNEGGILSDIEKDSSEEDGSDFEIADAIHSDFDVSTWANNPVTEEMLSKLNPKEKKKLKKARELVLFPRIALFEGHELMDTGRFLAKMSRGTATRDTDSTNPQQKRSRRKKNEEIVPGKGNREVCAMAVKLCYGGQCWATITENLQRWSRTDKFCAKCKVFLHPACHFWYHACYGEGIVDSHENKMETWQSSLATGQYQRLKLRDGLNKEFRAARRRKQASRKSVPDDFMNEPALSCVGAAVEGIIGV